MCRWLKQKPRGIYRVLHSAAAIRRRRIVVGEKRKQYHQAYDDLRKRIRFLDYCEYRRNHLPIGSGVTEAACKTGAMPKCGDLLYNCKFNALNKLRQYTSKKTSGIK